MRRKEPKQHEKGDNDKRVNRNKRRRHLCHRDNRRQIRYLKANDKALVDMIVDILAKNEEIAKLYDLWYEQREEVIRTYTDTMPERVSLSANKDFKSIKNAVIDEVMKLNADISVDKDSGYRKREHISRTNPTAESAHTTAHLMLKALILTQIKKAPAAVMAAVMSERSVSIVQITKEILTCLA